MKNVLANICAWSGTRRRNTSIRRTPSAFGVEYKEVRFRSAHADGVRLSGWLIPAVDAQCRGVVLLCHGHMSSRMNVLPKAVMLHRHHFTTLLFDFRAHGTSEGRLCTLGNRETDDVIGALNFLESHPLTCGFPIGALGESMGGASVITAAARDTRIQAVIAEGTFASLDVIMRRRFRLLFGPFSTSIANSASHIGTQKYDLDVTTISPADVIGQISPRPVFLITDGLDVTCPRVESDRLYSAACEPKQRWIASTAPHIHAFRAAEREYERRVAGFFEKNLSLK